MVNPQTISNAPLPHVGMDYARLRQEGLQLIEQLASRRWTDYNTHDPGITLLEALCYALTDLSYRLDFAIEDLLAYPADEPTPPALFLTAGQMLTVNPLTMADYRKLLIDLDGVKNAWLEPIDTPQPELFYDASKAALTVDPPALAEPVPLRGLYRVLLQKEPGFQAADATLVRTVRAKLQAHRNLCEDFADIKVLPVETITVHADVELVDGANPHRVMAQLYQAMAQIISPAITSVPLSDLLSRGVPVEDIFTGPRLEHGFIADDQLRQERPVELHTSDLIHVILDLPEVKTVRSITLASSRSQQPQDWALDLDPEFTPELKALEALLRDGDIQFYRGAVEAMPSVGGPRALPDAPQGLRYALDIEQVQQALIDLRQKSPDPAGSPIAHDLPIPPGEYRFLADYETLQAELPLTYGIGEIGLPASASPERQAQAKQLQAYLMVFDQLLANSFAQLDQMKNLFSPDFYLRPAQAAQTYFAQSIAHFPGGADLLHPDYADRLAQAFAENTTTQPDAGLERANRFLNHLLAQYGETVAEQHQLIAETDLATDIQHKAEFVAQVSQVSADRDRAFNYTQPFRETKLNVSGLKQRLARLLGFNLNQPFLASSETAAGFHLVEHILLRPREQPANDADDVLSFAQDITEFRAAEEEGYVTCTSPGHDLKNGEVIEIFFTSRYNGTYEVSNVQVDPPEFDIQREFLGAESGDAEAIGAWVRREQSRDPFSFQLSVVLPDWSEQLNQANFQQLLYDTFIAETPAHITLHFHWFSQDQMKTFENSYQTWLNYLTGQADEAASRANRELITLLKLGSLDIPEPPPLIGYMTIVEEDEDDVENPFRLF
jgi:hypothetical protein